MCHNVDEISNQSTGNIATQNEYLKKKEQQQSAHETHNKEVKKNKTGSPSKRDCASVVVARVVFVFFVVVWL